MTIDRKCVSTYYDFVRYYENATDIVRTSVCVAGNKPTINPRTRTVRYLRALAQCSIKQLFEYILCSEPVSTMNIGGRLSGCKK